MNHRMKKVLIALSAAYFDVTANYNLLVTCEKIYTTQVHNFVALRQAFGDRVRFIPDQCRSTIAFIQGREIETHPGCNVEFVHFEHLANNSRKSDEALATAMARIEALEEQVRAHQTDTRRLNYLAKLGQYNAGGLPGEAYTEFVVLARNEQSLRDALDRMARGVEFDKDCQPVSPPLARRVDPADIHAPSS